MNIVINIRRFSPIAYVAALFLAFPVFDSWYTDVVSLIRVQTGKLAVSTGVFQHDEGLMLGIFKPEVPYSFHGLQAMEKTFGKKIDIVSFYTTWGERSEDEFPMALMQAIAAEGAIAMLTWEPWTTEFSMNAGRGSDARRTDLGEIAGGRYDNWLRAWAREAIVYGKPFFLRFAHEMNNPLYPWSIQAGNTPADFIAAWRHVWEVFRSEGASNVIWVWSPKRVAPRELYPGGEYVDWIGTGVFNYGPQADAWYSFEYLFESVYRSVILYDKPIMIAELGCSAIGGSRPDWFSDAWRKLRTQYPATRAVVLYNNPVDRTLPGVEMDWAIENDDVTLATVARAVADGVFRK